MGLEWWVALIIILGGLLVLIATGMPIFVSFLVMCIVGIVIWWGAGPGLRQFILCMRDTLVFFALLPIPLFMLMGEVMFRSGVAPRMIDVLANWLGRLPGRLSFIAIAAGTLFATMSGAAIASTAMLGELLVPEMEKQGYKKPMTLGPIMAGGTLAPMIPPSGLAVFIGIVAEVSIARMLIAIIIPGLVMAVLYAVFIIVRTRLQPHLAPVYDVASIPLSVKLRNTGLYLLPLGFIIFLVTGIIIMGIATPSEAAATGALGTLILAFAYRGANWKTLSESVIRTVEITAMLLVILMMAKTYSQILAFSGATRGLVEVTLGLPVAPIGIIIAMQVLIIILGMFIGSAALMMIFVPVFMPIVDALGFDQIWFCVLFLINAELGGLTPPFGMFLFVMAGVAPRGTTIDDCIRSAVPFMLLILLAMALVIAFPQIALWLPGLM